MDFISTFSLLSGLCLHTSNGRVRTGLASLITIGSLVGGTGTATAQSAQVATGNASPATGGVTEIISREASGKVTLRATRVTRPIVLDGKLDDEIYQQVPAAGDFVQQEPVDMQQHEAAAEIGDDVAIPDLVEKRLAHLVFLRGSGYRHRTTTLICSARSIARHLPACHRSG